MTIAAGIALRFLLPFLDFAPWPKPTNLPWDINGASGSFSDSMKKNASPYVVELQTATASFTVKDRNGVEVYNCRVESYENTPFVIQNGILYLPLYCSIRTGCKVMACDLAHRRELWSRELFGIGDCSHLKYRNRVYCKIEGDKLIVYGDEDAGQFVEVVDLKTGQTLGNRGYHRDSRFDGTEFVKTLLLALIAIAAVGVVSEFVILLRKK